MSSFDIAQWEDLSRSDGQLNMYRYEVKTRVNGPGERFSLWLQGCLKRCPGCINAHMLEISEVSQLISPEQIVEIITSTRNTVMETEGLTVQGGEPFLQAKNLALLLEILTQELPDFNVLVFSGYTLEELQSFHSEDVSRVLAQTDTLIDGTYQRALRSLSTVAGSTNQRIHHLGKRRLSDRDFTRSTGLEVSGNPIFISKTGIPQKVTS